MVKIIPRPLIRIGSYITSDIECTCIVEENEFTVKSKYFILLPFDTKENLCVKIYFNDNNFKKYIIELYRVDK